MVHSSGKSRLGKFEEEVQSNTAFLLVAVFVDTLDAEETGNLYGDFRIETNIKYIFFTTKTTISSHYRQVVHLKDFDASAQTEVIYLKMFQHVYQHFEKSFDWLVFTESTFFVNIDTLRFLKNMNCSNEFLFIPEVTRKSGDGYIRQNNRTRTDKRGYHRIKTDIFSRVMKENRRSNMNIFHIFHPGTILSRSLVTKLSSLTEKCVQQKTNGFRECFKTKISISWLNNTMVIIAFSTLIARGGG
jgi:hypothetical protein